MIRAYIPKPNKPGKLRPITPPARRDRIVMDGMAILLNIVFESTFLPCSHGFRPGKGPLTFMTCVENWRDVDRLIKADVVACFDSIDHQILIDKLGKHVGSRNGALLR